MGYELSAIYVWANQVRPASLLPKEYQQVGWIQSDWAQWINTWYNPTTGSKAEISYRPVSRVSSKELWIFAIWSGSCRWRAWSTTSGAGDTWYWFTYSPSFSIGGDTIATWNYNTASSYPVYLFAQDENWSAYHLNQWVQRIYYCKIWTWDTLVREMYPCYRKLDGVIWMYDIVNDTFYTNSWSWTFTKWWDV